MSFLKRCSSFGILSLALLSCAKMDNKESADYGATVPSAAKDEFISKNMGHKNLYDIKEGEWIISQTTQRAFTGSRNVSGVVAIGVSSVSEDAKYRTLRLIVRNIQYGTTKTDGTKDAKEDRYLEKVVIPKKPTLDDLQASVEHGRIFAKYFFMQTAHARELSISAVLDGAGAPPQKPSAGSFADADFSYCQSDSTQQKVPDGFEVTYHRLELKQETVSPPRMVVEQTSPACAGLNPCQIQKSAIHYDEVLWKKGSKENQHYHCSHELSEDVPYLATSMKRCMFFIYAWEGHKAPIEICSSIADFQFGN